MIMLKLVGLVVGNDSWGKESWTSAHTNVVGEDFVARRTAEYANNVGWRQQ
jgi:hypothetical protein